MRARISLSLLIGGASGAFCWYILHHFNQQAADFQWAIRAARYALAGKNPYDTALEQYPITAALFAIPFLRLPAEMAAAAFFGTSSALLAFGLTRHGYTRLIVFLAYPYWAAILTAQWSPLIMASALFPLLLPATMAKPQVGLPVALTHLTRTGISACILWSFVSLLLMPRWPWLWVGQWGHYDHFLPLLVWPGPLLLLALLRYRESDCWFLLLTALMPQRWFFDAFILWLIPKSRRELLFTSLISWGAGLWRWYYPPASFAQVGRWAVACLYLPMLAVILLRSLTRDAYRQPC
ncbi:MAG: hypothetical protein JO266_21875 [Acidobacteria bacterium]|nr:hypothetical protein [Acidobacteriota bacterium]MBV8894591.1 hypothetical protein [Acidobacteriota bacterium]MBV9480168.1 hypothetical protein [Acidobacteriota bacterium]